MGAKQLAIVIAPNILKSVVESTDPSSIVSALASVNQVVYKIINHHFNGNAPSNAPQAQPQSPIAAKMESTVDPSPTEAKKEPTQRVPLSQLKPPTNFPEIEAKPETPNHQIRLHFYFFFLFYPREAFIDTRHYIRSFHHAE